MQQTDCTLNLWKCGCWACCLQGMSSLEPTLMFLYECQVPGIQYTVAVHEQLSDIVASGLLLGSIRHQVCPLPPKALQWKGLLAGSVGHSHSTTLLQATAAHSPDTFIL